MSCTRLFGTGVAHPSTVCLRINCLAARHNGERTRLSFQRKENKIVWEFTPFFFLFILFCCTTFHPLFMYTLLLCFLWQTKYGNINSEGTSLLDYLMIHVSHVSTIDLTSVVFSLISADDMMMSFNFVVIRLCTEKSGVSLSSYGIPSCRF